MSPHQAKPHIGISACLLGQEVRFNGGHKHSKYCTQQLAEHFQFEPVCPEVGIGLGIPREPIRLVGDITNPRAVKTHHPEEDVTAALVEFSQHKVQQLAHLSGYILMQKSPSCGMERVKVYASNGYALPGGGVGVFAKALMKAYPLLPVEEEGRLHDPVIRENFINRVFAYHEWQTTVVPHLSKQAIIQFHSRYKYLLMAHQQKEYRSLGRIVAQIAHKPLKQIADTYITAFMKILSVKASRKNHCNVLQHILGFLKKNASAKTKQQILESIESYRSGILPLIVPVTLINHYVEQYGNDYIRLQTYLHPHPPSLGLRNQL
ncbi:DUF1722 domain-containing protein [Endozoicomonas sp. SM1973]|uniref:DUF1722 domain-containing protein n=1 Tax=Spartinivicinus marinus TaxID=2994442 RepID=A0A853IAN3_9GAMM|nr:DUF523 and DUF1722 domain-containing protein [Spartinivicinus marinus]MCX4025016.1 DUF523 and DUF1722 domain-containing protein [Spartinivicinus marinus]NYZ67708.1 DUF1722 domain-containing protein [Spartinivicinus marinus]